MTCSCLVSQRPRDDIAIPGQTAPGSRCPTIPTICQPNTRVVSGTSMLGSHQEENEAVGTGRPNLHLIWPLLRKGFLDWCFLAWFQDINLKPPRVNGTEHFLAKGFVYSPGGEYRKLSSRVFFHYGEELNKSSRQTFSFLFHPLNRSFLSSRYRAGLGLIWAMQMEIMKICIKASSRWTSTCTPGTAHN